MGNSDSLTSHRKEKEKKKPLRNLKMDSIKILTEINIMNAVLQIVGQMLLSLSLSLPFPSSLLSLGAGMTIRKEIVKLYSGLVVEFSECSD